MNRRILAVFALALLFSFAAVASAQVQECGPHPRLISVMGTAEVNVAPDQVSLSVGVEAHDKELGIAKSKTDARVKKVLALARGAGVVPKDIETSALRMGPDYSEEKIPKFLGYEASQTISITLKDLSKYEDLMTKLLEGGINRVSGISFDVGETRKYRDEARLKAIRAAKEKAVAMATELGQTVGKPWEISEENGWNSYLATANSTSNSSYRYNSQRAEADDSTVAPGQVTIRASVRVSFQLE